MLLLLLLLLLRKLGMDALPEYHSREVKDPGIARLHVAGLQVIKAPVAALDGKLAPVAHVIHGPHQGAGLQCDLAAVLLAHEEV